MSRSPLTSWYASPFTGLFRRWGPIPLRPHDPAIPAWSGVLPHWAPDGSDLAVGGVGLDLASAEAAALGEAVERRQARPLPLDALVEASFANWPLDEPAVEPSRWVLYHPDQYALGGFPFSPFLRESVCRWVSCRRAGGGEPCWAPDWQVFLEASPYGPSLSTGLSAGRVGDPVLLRGLQEVIERDALVGAWWGSYPLQEHDPEQVFALLGADLASRLRRPNLRYRFYRVVTPFSSHATVATLAGEDHEGFCFSAGAACREDRAGSWTKATLEAVQGRHYVRYLLRTRPPSAFHDFPTDFAGHALYHSLRPDRLRQTVLERPTALLPSPPTLGGEGSGVRGGVTEGWPALAERLGRQRPVLFRLLTPPGVSAAGLDWVVLRVIVPGLQPLHGHHGYPFLGGPLWSRPVADHASVLPHPFP
jgi:ribosomal protein S12 methylthiotransferase accessory factor